MTGKIVNRITVDSIPYQAELSIVTDAGQRVDKTGDNVLPAAKVGQLTTRTDNNTGTLTMNAGHGIVSGRLDVYWVGGSRRGMAATVTVNSIAIDGGSGDNLPTNLTNVTASQPAEEAMLFDGDNVKLIFARATRRSLIVFTDDSDVEAFAIVGEIGGTVGGAYQWRDPAEVPVASDGGVTNPLAGKDVAKVYLSNGDSAGTSIAQVGVGTD